MGHSGSENIIKSQYLVFLSIFGFGIESYLNDFVNNFTVKEMKHASIFLNLSLETEN